MRPGELGNVAVELDIAPIGEEKEIDEAIAILSASFGAPEELFIRLCETLLAIPETIWYV